MSLVPPVPEIPIHDADAPFDPVRERERILAQVRGRALDANQAEFVCATLAMLAEMEAER